MSKPPPIIRAFPGNKTEREYAGMLRMKLLAGEILDYRFEAMKFMLGNRCWYTPDFLVITPTHVELHEVKGGFYRDDARVKFKAAAEKYPRFSWMRRSFSHRRP